MPTYEYECASCGNRFELFHGVKESPKEKCPECGKLGAKKLIGAGAGFIFKGSGFYATDYKKTSSVPKSDAPTPSKKSENNKANNTKTVASGADKK
ncbi:MAG: hypothetical protein A2W23_02830 [Planctomycetes bacterium RBG_16_43_13]|nr:MAG: hypothetical protein A2W23_02830 [Planctomycetes bacterium RBG_16_43_13]